MADFTLETKFWDQGKQYIAGIDEVGRGPWAGPVVAAVVIFPAYLTLPKLPHDSKQLSEKQRYELKDIIEAHALTISIGEISADEIDRSGIVPSTHQAMAQALSQLSVTPDFHFVDGSPISPIPPLSQLAIVKGDALSATIAAASIIAKIYRDELMVSYSKQLQYEKYGFEKHKGYGTKLHKEALLTHGPSDLHRRSFIHF